MPATPPTTPTVPTTTDLRHIYDAYVEPFGVNLLIALVIFFAGRWIARALVRGAGKMMESSGVDTSLRKFMADVLYATLIVAVVTAALDRVGVHTTAVVAVLGAAGLTVGLALQGSLSNFAAGVMLIILRTYKVGDLVIIGKYTGRVDAIKVFHTILVTSDNREVTIPNGTIVSGPIENLTALGTRRVDILISVGQGTDLHKVKQWVEGVARSDKRVLAAPAPSLDLTEITPDAIKLYLRPWTTVEDYAFVAADTIERVREALAAHDVKFSVFLDKPA
jgi:small conductance mechanosensitive channel